MLACLPFPSPADLSRLSNEEFTARWRALIGEPPSILLQDRAEMVRLLVESMAPVPCQEGPAAVAPSGLADAQAAKSPAPPVAA